MSNIFDDHLPPLPSKGAVDEPNVRSNKRRGIEGVSGLAQRRGAIRLQDMTELAFETLEEAMRYAEYPVAVSACKTVLDRSGYGPSSTLNINDLSGVSTEELASLALRLASRVSSSPNSNDNNTAPTTTKSTDSIH